MELHGASLTVNSKAEHRGVVVEGFTLKEPRTDADAHWRKSNEEQTKASHLHLSLFQLRWSVPHYLLLYNLKSEM